MFFFSSRRRHTRLQGDWSSDVCSSDLFEGSSGQREPEGHEGGEDDEGGDQPEAGRARGRALEGRQEAEVLGRSEERRVGKEGSGQGLAGEDERQEERRLRREQGMRARE